MSDHFSHFANSQSAIPPRHLHHSSMINPFAPESFPKFEPGTLLHELQSPLDAVQVVDSALEKIQKRTQYKLRFIELCKMIPDLLVEQ